jgi:hypothetical protein
MRSDERHLAREERRRAARKQKRDTQLREFDDFSRVTDADNLYAAFIRSKSGVAWKESIQRYEANALVNIFETQRKLIEGENIQNGFVEFDLNERGKKRHIKSVHISERVVQKCLCDAALVPILSRPLIHDNGASLKGKRVHFALRRLIVHLSRFYRRNGFSNDGYALLVDFSKFFDSVNHAKLFALIDREMTDPRLRELTRRFISVFGPGVSLGIGSQVSQVAAVFYPNPLDHFIKERLSIKYYGRYMDDLYLIHQDREYLKYCLAEIHAVCDTLSLRFNEKKTRIVKLSSGISFLKGRYVLTEYGRIVRLPCKESTARMRRKLKKFKALIEAGNMDVQDLRIAYQSWRGNYMKRFDAYYRIRRMDALYHELFINSHLPALPDAP